MDEQPDTVLLPEPGPACEGKPGEEYPGALSQIDTVLLPQSPDVRSGEQKPPLPAHLEDIATEKTRLLPPSKPGINEGQKPTEPGLLTDDKGGDTVLAFSSRPGIFDRKTPWPGVEAKTPLPPSLAGIKMDETVLDVDDAWRVEQEETMLLPSPLARREGRQRLTRRRLTLLACLSALALAVLLGVSMLAAQTHEKSGPPVGPISHITPAATKHPSPPLTPQAQPISPFPTTLQREVSTLEAHDRLFYNGNTDLPEIALTFDDGPNPAYTPQVLAILKKYHVHATFFDIGYLVKDYPELVQQEVSEGHVVGNHTWSHPDLPTMTQKQIHDQIKNTSDELQKVLGSRPIFVRPPYGDISTRVLTVINKFAMTTIIWNDEAQDWALPGTSVIVQRVMNLAYNGAIILLHDGGGVRTQTVQALPTIIQRLRARGFRFVTMDEIVAHAHQHAGKGTPTPLPTSSSTTTPSPEHVLFPRLGIQKEEHPGFPASR